MLVDQQKLAFLISVRSQSAIYMIYQARRLIGMDGGSESEKSMLSVHLEDDEEET